MRPTKFASPTCRVSVLGACQTIDHPTGHTRIAPDLAVEVISPNDLATEIDEKIAEYLAAGVRLVWVVNPQMKSVRIHRPTDAKLGAISALSEHDKISGEDVLESFE